MDEHHSTNWIEEIHKPLGWCCDVEHDDLYFDDEDEYDRHVQKTHPEYEAEKAELKDWGELQRERPPYTCPICNCVPEELAAISPWLREGKIANPAAVRTKLVAPAPTEREEAARDKLLLHIGTHLKQLGLMSVAYFGDDADSNSMGSKRGSVPVDKDGKVLLIENPPDYFDPQFEGYVRTEPKLLDEGVNWSDIKNLNVKTEDHDLILQHFRSHQLPPSPKKPPTEAPSTANSSDPSPYRSRDIYIAVIGETGVGKTTFIKDVTGLDLDIADNLDSCTQVVEEFEATVNGQVVKFIDTPGFNDSRRTDSEILEVIGTYLREAHAKEIYLTAVIYLQWIHETRMRGSAIKNLRILKLLCGEEYYGNIVLVTTGWTTPPREIHVNYETQLRTQDRFWGEFIKIGATFQRHTTGRDSALEIVNHALGKTPSVLQFQRELAKVGIIGRTTAGEQLILEIGRQRDNDKKLIESLRTQLKDSEQRNKDLDNRLRT